VELATDLGGRREATSARLWRGQVLVDWQADEQAGDCLLRPDLLRKLLPHVKSMSGTGVSIQVPGRVVAALSAHHADLVRRLGGARRIALTIDLRIHQAAYLGGEETYSVVERGRQTPLLRLRADVRLRAKSASPHTSPDPR
jgi:hypothetical protein